jgi:hypothetical protein
MNTTAAVVLPAMMAVRFAAAADVVVDVEREVGKGEVSLRGKLVMKFKRQVVGKRTVVG